MNETNNKSGDEPVKSVNTPVVRTVQTMPQTRRVVQPMVRRVVNGAPQQQAPHMGQPVMRPMTGLNPAEEIKGYLDVSYNGDGHGFIRPKFRPSDKDVYIAPSQIRRLGLRPGDFVEGQGRSPKEN